MNSFMETQPQIFSTTNCSTEESKNPEINFLKTALNSRASLNDIQDRVRFLDSHFTMLMSAYYEQLNQEIKTNVDCLELVVREYFQHRDIKTLELEEATIQLKPRKARYERTDVPCGMACQCVESPVTIFEEGTLEYDNLKALYPTDELPEGLNFYPFSEEIIVTRKKKVIEG